MTHISENGPHHEQTCFFFFFFLSCMNNKGADQHAHPHSLISAFVVRCLDSNEILQLKAI